MLTIEPISAFQDNYIWLLQGQSEGGVAVVDPGDEQPVLELLERRGEVLAAIMITHKHGDHTGGIAGLLEAFPGVPVFGPANEPIGLVDRPLTEGDVVAVPGPDMAFTVLEVPGHTEGHIAYYGAGVLFCGDTLFAGGCGRVFSGTHRQLNRSLQRIAALPPETRLYCAHEYTADNLGFARWVEPDNPYLLERQSDTARARSRGEPTVPSSLQLELRTNPFLRTGEPAVIAAAERYAGTRLANGEAVFTAIRNWKDREYD
jgi:hydroxyacylglutathione hydrolase